MSTDNEKWGRLKYLAQKATPGPWWVDSHGHRVSTADGMQTVFVADDTMGPSRGLVISSVPVERPVRMHSLFLEIKSRKCRENVDMTLTRSGPREIVGA